VIAAPRLRLGFAFATRRSPVRSRSRPPDSKRLNPLFETESVGRVWQFALLLNPGAVRNPSPSSLPTSDGTLDPASASRNVHSRVRVRKLPSTGTKTVQLEYAKTFDLLGFSWLELYRVAGEIGLRTRRSSSTLPVTGYRVTISNDAGRGKSFCVCFFVKSSTPLRRRTNCVYFRSCSSSASPYVTQPLFSSTWCCPPVISSITNDHDEFFDLPVQGGG